MLIITKKTPRSALVAEIELLRTLRDSAARAEHDKHDKHADIVAALENNARLSLAEATERAEHAEHKADVLETDVHNLLGALRVMADSSRVVRIRRSSVKPSDIATALPHRNTDKV